jgi:membrane-associated phospholipid phosphatase
MGHVIRMRRRSPATLAGLGCLGLVVLLGLAVGQRSTVPDEHVRQLLQSPLPERPYQRAISVLATETGWPHAAYGMAMLPVVLAGVLLAADAVQGRAPQLRQWRWLALTLLAIPLQYGLRVAFNRAGPAVPLWAESDRGAYPSGAALLLALGWGIGLAVVAEVRPRWRPAAMAGAAVVLTLHAVARVAADKHWATDVLGSYLLAGGVLLLAAASRQ